MNRFSYLCTSSDQDSLSALVEALSSDGAMDSEPAFFEAAPEATSRLPEGLKEALDLFARTSAIDMLSIDNLPNFESPDTPLSHSDRLDGPILPREAILGLAARCLGTPFGYPSQQHGRIFNDIIPIAGQETIANSSAGNTKEFRLHTEDAYFAAPPSHIGWACHRNSEEAGTKLAAISSVRLPSELIDELQKPVFTVPPNVLQGGIPPLENVALVWEEEGARYMRINLNGPGREAVSGRAQEAYDAFEAQLEQVARPEVFHVDAILFLNNARVAHGRLPYNKQSQGQGRWITRIVVH